MSKEIHVTRPWCIIYAFNLINIIILLIIWLFLTGSKWSAIRRISPSKRSVNFCWIHSTETRTLFYFFRSLSFNKSITYSYLICKNSLMATVNTPIQLLECFFWLHWVVVQQIHNHSQNTLRSFVLESLYYLLIFIIIMGVAIAYICIIQTLLMNSLTFLIRSVVAAPSWFRRRQRRYLFKKYEMEQ